MLPIKVLKRTEGKILTILEAAITQDDGGLKLEATKSLIRQELGELYSWADHDESQFEKIGVGGSSTSNKINEEEVKKDKKMKYFSKKFDEANEY